jgi:TPP-dependent indolepyruvate ferredoxin oxidoreductase alpha subunit
MIPVLYPSSVQEILDLGLHGWAMSRYSGCWVGFKCVADTVESSSSGLHRPGPHEDHRARRLSDAAFRPVDPLARWLSRDRSADAGLQDLRGAPLLPRQPAEPQS